MEAIGDDKATNGRRLDAQHDSSGRPDRRSTNAAQSAHLIKINELPEPNETDRICALHAPLELGVPVWRSFMIIIRAAGACGHKDQSFEKSLQQGVKGRGENRVLSLAECRTIQAQFKALRTLLSVLETVYGHRRRVEAAEPLCYTERRWDWRSQIVLLALVCKRALTSSGHLVKQRRGKGVRPGADVGTGFFSANKLNLRNAP